MIELTYIGTSETPGHVLKQSNPVQSKEDAEVLGLQVTARRPYTLIGIIRRNEREWVCLFRCPQTEPLRDVQTVIGEVVHRYGQGYTPEHS